MSTVHRQHDPRAELEAKLASLHQLLARFEGLQQQERAVFQRHAHKYRPYQRSWGVGTYMLWALLIAVGLVILAVVNLTNASSGVSSSGSEAIGSLLLFLLILPVAFIAAALLLAVQTLATPFVNAARQKRNRKRETAIAELVAPELYPIRAEIQEVTREFNARFLGFFPVDYCTTEDVGMCWRLVRDHRASTVVEARREHETLLHRQRLENGVAAQLDAAHRAAKVAAFGNVVSAVGFGAMAGSVAATRRRW